AWELAQRATRLGRPPVQLFAISAGAPDTEVPAIEGLHERSDDDLVVAVAAAFGGLEATPITPALIAAVVPGLRADLEILNSYQYAAAPRLPCPIGVFAGHGDPIAPLAALEAWRGHTDGAFFLRRFPGGHFFFRDARDAVVSDIVAALGHRRDLAELARR
ncbi:MAG TPA: thioesterase domain-containing protein, partial [Kofleriaceae bacterium]|nr:thioesterase domain-containing protein [Kofleriaceae bacterium]